MDKLEKEERNSQYVEYINKIEPKTSSIPALIIAFFVGGAICCFGEFVCYLLVYFFPMMSLPNAYTWTQIILIFLAILFTGFGVYDDLGKFAGAGSIIPITGFANSVASPAMEYKREGIIFGICVKMFIVAGPVIVTAIVSSVAVGIIYAIIG